MLSKLLPKRGEHGFTLIELLIVVIIIGVLAAIALPIFINQQKQAVEASVKSDARNTVTNVVNWFAQNQDATPTDVAAYTTAGGKVARSNAKTFVGVNFAAPGDYTVCAYNDGAAKSVDSDHAFVFTSSTGQFSSGDCNLAADASGTTGSTGGSTANDTHNVELITDTWQSYGAKTSNGSAQQYKFLYQAGDAEFDKVYKKMTVSGDLAGLFTAASAPAPVLCSVSNDRTGTDYNSGSLNVSDSTVHLYGSDGSEINKNNADNWTLNLTEKCDTQYDTANFTIGDGHTSVAQAYAGIALSQNSVTSDEDPDAAVANDSTVPAKIVFTYENRQYTFDNRDCASTTCS